MGIGQTWQDVTASRALNVTYTNTTNRPIVVMVTCAIGAFQLSPYVNGVWLGMNGNSTGYNNAINWIVPAAATYSLSVSSGWCSLQGWTELR